MARKLPLETKVKVNINVAACLWAICWLIVVLAT